MAKLYQLRLAAANDKKRRVAAAEMLVEEEAAYKGSDSNRDNAALARQTGGPLDKKPKKEE